MGPHIEYFCCFPWWWFNRIKFSQDQKKMQDLLLTEKEAIYGSKPSPRKSNSFRKPNGCRANGNGSMTPTPRRNSIGSGTPELLTPRSYSSRQNGHFREMRRLSTAPLNFVAILKEDTMSSYTSVCGSEPGSPPQGWKWVPGSGMLCSTLYPLLTLLYMNNLNPCCFAYSLNLCHHRNTGSLQFQQLYTQLDQWEPCEYGKDCTQCMIANCRSIQTNGNWHLKTCI